MPQCAPAERLGHPHLSHATATIGDWISYGPGFVLGLGASVGRDYIS